jgi:hypothetical protein
MEEKLQYDAHPKDVAGSGARVNGLVLGLIGAVQ